MRRPFERLMELVAQVADEDRPVTMGELSAAWGEPVGRIGDAIDAVQVCAGQRTYIDVWSADEEGNVTHREA